MGFDKEQFVIILTTPVYLIVILIEILLSNYRHEKAYSVKDTLQNIYFMLLNAGIDFFLEQYTLALYLIFFMSIAS